MYRWRVAFIGAAVLSAAFAPAPAGAESVRGLASTLLPALEGAELRALSGDPDAMQARYDAARALVEALRGRVSSDCGDALAALTSYAQANVAAAEAFDRKAVRARSEARARAGRAAVRRALGRCPVGRLREGSAANGLPLLEPRNGEAFAGLVRARTPAGAVRAELWTDGTRVAVRSAGHPMTTVRMPAARAGPGDVELRFLDRQGAVVARARARGAWLLPSSAAVRPEAARHDARLRIRLAALAGSFPGYSAVLVHDLASGRTGSWHADARFPAASTVKLGVLVATLRAAGAAPERSGTWYDLVQLAGWSSNLAANRLFEALGRGVVEATLRRIGATASTYPGAYRVGTAHRPSPPSQPPLVSQRVTTAGDLAAVLETIHRAAFGDPAAQRASGLSRHQARLALALLLESNPVGENIGLFHAALPAGMPVAQKQGWLSDAFHTAAIVYTPSGPVVCVLLTYRDGITRVEATQLGAGVVDVALRR